MGFKDKFRRKNKEHQDRQHKHTEWRYEGGNGGHRVTFARDLQYHPSGTTPAQSRTDLQLPTGGVGRVEEREWGNDRERRRRRERGRGNIPPEPSPRRASHAPALTLGEESGDEEAATSNSNIGNNATRAVPAAGTGATTTTTPEQDSPTPEAGGAGWAPYAVGAAVGIGVVVTPFIAVSMGTALGCASAAAGLTAIVNNLSNNNRAVQESHDRRMITEAQIDAARDVEKHKVTVQAQERIMRRMVDKGQYGPLDMLGNGDGNRRRSGGSGRLREIGHSRRVGLLE